ncbi:MAG: class I SAM-dependent methyltransferase [Lachnospiraceae bacterium]|nr:class I SAM-dependent methyltransferase [Lachnospiraceae bacterium]
MSSLYERADIYDLIESEKRTEIIREDWKQFLGDRQIRTFLDVSIGTGGMTLPLQELGIEVFGSDLSEEMLSRCRKKALAKQKPVRLEGSDFRDLACWKGMQFDCVASTGNALGYVSNGDVLKTIEQMDALIRPGGYFCFDSRNWEMILQEKQRFYVYNPFFRDGTRINLVQVWDHNADGSITFNLLYTFEQENKIVQKEIFEEHYHPFPLKLVTDKLSALGYGSVCVRPFPCSVPETDFHKIEWYRLIARKHQAEKG